MKRNLLLVLILSMITQFSFAQLTFSGTEFNEALPIDTEVELTFYVTNTSTESKLVKWERTETLPDGWYSFICDKQQCFIPGVSENSFNVDPSEELTFKITFNAATTDVGTASLFIYDVNDNTDSGTVTFNLNSTTSNFDLVDVDNVKVYPNPASDYIKLSNADGIATMEMFNLIGKKVKIFNDVQTDQPYNVSDLPKGMYMVRLLDDEGESLGTKRISIR